MNENKVKGKATDIAGKIQREVGEAVGSSEQQAKGLAKQVEGKAQHAAGEAEEAVRDEALRNRGKNR